MSLVINTNVASLNAQRSLTASGAELKTAMERLSSGKKINSAADDAAGFAIAERMTAQIRGLNMAAKNANDGLSMLSTIENATSDITGMLHRMRELAVQGINDTNGAQDRAYLQLEVDALMEEINRVSSDTQYNGSSVLNGNLTHDYTGNSVEVGGITISGSSTFTISVNGGAAVTVTADASPSATNLTTDTNAAPGISGITVTDDGGGNWKFEGSGLSSLKVNSTEVEGTPSTVGGSIQVGTEKGQSVAFSINSVDTVALNLSNAGTAEDHNADGTQFVAGTSQISVASATAAGESLAKITSAIEQVAGDRAGYGALQNRLEYTVSNLLNVAEYTTAARSRIEDADFAAESARLAKAQVLQQAGTAMLAQANASSQLALSLFR